MEFFFFKITISPLDTVPKAPLASDRHARARKLLSRGAFECAEERGERASSFTTLSLSRARVLFYNQRGGRGERGESDPAMQLVWLMPRIPRAATFTSCERGAPAAQGAARALGVDPPCDMGRLIWAQVESFGDPRWLSFSFSERIVYTVKLV